MAEGSERAAAGEPGEARALVECVYGELRRLAHRRMAGEADPATLQPTALVHETWLRLAREGRATWESRAQFFSAAATAMRRILVERARARRRLKRGGAQVRIPWDEERVAAGASVEPGEADAESLLELDLALEALRGFDERLARIVELRAFAGLTEVETGGVLGLSARSVRRDWRAARLWLWRWMRRAEGASQEGRSRGR